MTNGSVRECSLKIHEIHDVLSVQHEGLFAHIFFLLLRSSSLERDANANEIAKRNEKKKPNQNKTVLCLHKMSG